MKWKSMLWRKCMNSACQFYHCIRTHMWIEYARSRSEKIYYYCAVMQPTNCWPSTISFIEMLLRTNIMVRGCFGMRQTYVTENRRSSIHDICLTYVSAVASRWIWKNLVSIVFFIFFVWTKKRWTKKKAVHLCRRTATQMHIHLPNWRHYNFTNATIQLNDFPNDHNMKCDFIYLCGMEITAIWPDIMCEARMKIDRPNS